MIKLKTYTKTILADTKTPTGIFMTIRDFYQKPLLLESSDYNSKQNHYSYICLNPLATFELFNNKLSITKNEEPIAHSYFPANKNIDKLLKQFNDEFEFENLGYDFCTSGIFGYNSFNALEYFEDIALTKKENTNAIPEVLYYVYSLILVFNHSTNNLNIFSHASSIESAITQLDELVEKLHTEHVTEFNFNVEGTESSNLSDDDFIALVKKSKEHVHKGDVFQIVMSRQFSQRYSGDDFNLYRSLKNINPSPYLFYFDTGKFRLIGSSPEAQLIISNNKAQINPIAGTFKRTGNDLLDFEKATTLLNDKKETAEHMMLVDLARNDLSKYCINVEPKYLKQIQLYSHVIHLASKIEGELRKGIHPIEVLFGSSPAGTLSGAPKYRALELIDKYEPTSRGYYGGSIGFVSSKNELNHAIMIRTFLSKDNILFYQAGAGIVNASEPASENLEIYNKTSALTKAIKEAQKINKNKPSHSHETISA